MDGATVTLTNTATGEAQTAVTGSDGSFTVSGLAPGTYRVDVRLKSGLQLGESSVEINSNGSSQVQATFSPNAATATGALEINARSPTLETDTAEVARSYDTNTIRSLPIIDRQNQELITLMPGTSPPVATQDRIRDPQRSRSINVNGQPAWANLYSQDGAYDNEPVTGRPLRLQPNEGVQALEVRTSNYNAEYGVAAGSWASNVTRPGTNAIHGSLFEFNTNSFFTTGRSLAATTDTPRFNLNQFGATLGGPAIRDRLFWFISYEGLIQRGRQEAEATVPSADLLAGNFSGMGATIYNPYTGTAAGTSRLPYPNNTISGALRNPAATNILGLIPAANQAGFFNNLVGSVPLLGDTHRLDGKIDHRFSEKSTGFFRYGFTQSSVDQGSLLGPVGSPLNAEMRAMNAVGSLTQLFSNSLLAEFRFGYDRYRNQITPWGDFSALNGLAPVGFPNGLPSINIAGFSPLGLPADVPSKQIDNVYDGATNWVSHIGINQVKFGVEIRELQANGIINPFFSSLGSFTFGPGATLNDTAAGVNLTPATLQANAFAAFLAGAPTQAGVAAYPFNPAYRQRQYGAYAVDTVNLFQRLWLELGVRYDVFSPIDPMRSGTNLVYDPSTNSTVVAGVNGVSGRLSRYDLNNVAPRVGLAFRPIDRLVFRGGYGIHYFPLPFALAGLNPVTESVQSGISGGLAATSFTVPVVPANTSGVAASTPYYVSPRSRNTPYVETYSAMLQGDLGNGFLLDVGYVGNAGRQLPYSIASVGLPGSGAAGLPVGAAGLFYTQGAGLTSNYNSGQVNLTKRFGAGLSLAAAYTYSKALDYGYNLLDPFARANNYGPADWDRTHVLAISHVWRLPFGVNQKYYTSGWAARILGDWELNGLLHWATGTPYTITADPLACACLGAAAVPAALNSGATGSMVSLNGSASFNPSLFSAPASGTFGSLSRNSIRGPDMFVYNLALFRNFAVTENIKLEFRGEAYNLTNSANWMNPVAGFGSPGFGTSLGSLGGAPGRQFQVAARLLF
jgi:hypothetical protein